MPSTISKGYEIERKFLVRLPELDELSVKCRLDIVQTYLRRGDNGSQRRVRSITEDGRVTYTYTEKQFVTAVTRIENEYGLTEAEYRELLKQSDRSLVPVVKTRYRFDCREQLFELDVYPYSDELAVLELELRTPEQEIFFPDNIEVIKDISDDKDYSNAALAKRGAFPEQI